MARTPLRSAIAVCTATGTLVVGVSAQNPASGLTTTGQQLNVQVNGTPPGASAASDPIPMTGSAKLGPPVALPINVIYVFDVSGSMGVPDAPGTPDCNGDGIGGTRIDAACVGLTALHQSLGTGANVDVGIVALGTSGASADLSPDAGLQLFASPPNADEDFSGTADVIEVLTSADSDGGIDLFTPVSVGSSATNYTAALAAMNAAFATQPAGETNIAFFVSDGFPNTGGSFDAELAAAVAAGTVIHTVGVSASAAGACDPGGPLDEIALATGGSCAFAADPSSLDTVLPSAGATEISRVELFVNGTQVAEAHGPEAIFLGTEELDVLPLLQPGPNVVECIATTIDGSEVTASQSVQVPVSLLLVSTGKLDVDLGEGDILRVDPSQLFIAMPVTMEEMPVWPLGTDPQLFGLAAYMQVVVYDELTYPSDPLRLSNGLEVILGQGALGCGAPNGITLWLDELPLLGGNLVPKFWIHGL